MIFNCVKQGLGISFNVIQKFDSQKSCATQGRIISTTWNLNRFPNIVFLCSGKILLTGLENAGFNWQDSHFISILSYHNCHNGYTIDKIFSRIFCLMFLIDAIKTNLEKKFKSLFKRNEKWLFMRKQSLYILKTQGQRKIYIRRVCRK